MQESVRGDLVKLMGKTELGGGGRYAVSLFGCNQVSQQVGQVTMNSTYECLSAASILAHLFPILPKKRQVGVSTD